MHLPRSRKAKLKFSIENPVEVHVLKVRSGCKGLEHLSARSLDVLGEFSSDKCLKKSISTRSNFLLRQEF